MRQTRHLPIPPVALPAGAEGLADTGSTTRHGVFDPRALRPPQQCRARLVRHARATMG